MKLKLFITLISAILLAGCASQTLSEPEAMTQKSTSPPGVVYVPNPSSTVNDLTVSNVVANFARLNPGSRSSLKQVEEIIPVKAEDGSNLMYIVNYVDNGGFLIISGRKEYEPILAFSDEGNISIEEIDRNGLSVWFEEQSNVLTNTNLISSVERDKFASKWRNLDVTETEYAAPISSRASSPTLIGNLINAQLQKWQQEGCEVYVLEDFRRSQEFQSFPASVQNDFLNLPYGYAYKYASGGQYAVSFVIKRTVVETNDKVNPICKTTWGQALGYNQSVPEYDWNNPGNWPLGCVTIATAQILMAHKYPNDIAWNSFPFRTYNTSLCQFLYKLAVDIGVERKIDKAGASINDAKKVFENYGYNVYQINHFVDGHTNSFVTDNLDKGYPVYMRGESSDGKHAWVCDGYESSAYSWTWELWCLEDCPESYDPQYFYKITDYIPMTSYGTFHLHMNWGWYGSDNGFFLDTKITTSNGNYSNDRKDLVNIYPKQ